MNDTQNTIFRPLDFLKKRPIPIKKQDIFIQFKEKDKPDIKDDIVDDKIVIDKPKIKIIDKRNDYDINRSEIIERLKQKNAFQIPVTRNIQSKKPSIVVDTMLPSSKTFDATKTKKSITIQTKPDTEIQKEIQKEVQKQVQKEEKDSDEEIIEESEPSPETISQDIPKIKDKEIVKDLDLSEIIINDVKLKDRLPVSHKFDIKTSNFYLNNRKIFIQKINELFIKHFQEIKEDKTKISCDKDDNSKFSLLTHQKVIKDYFNLYTPYRGLLLYHGLGSGKTCSSIALAEGMKNDKNIILLTPASLKMNFFSELKKCGDEIYKINQFWEFISIEGKSEYINILSQTLSLPTDYIKKNGGAWLVNVNKASNFKNLSNTDQKNIDEQINHMIRTKYIDINYNAPNLSKIISSLSSNFTKNPFDNCVIVIDEAHNFVSRIVNKIKQNKSISYKMYDYLMSASNARIVFLTGTPIINYPNEVGILYNMLRGYIKTWKFTLASQFKLTYDEILKMFDKANFKTFDFIEYKDKILTITRNPFGFINTKKRGVAKGTQRKFKPEARKTQKITAGNDNLLFNKYNGVKLDSTGNISDQDFLQTVISILKSNKINIQETNIEVENNKCLPDDSDEFNQYFIDEDLGTFKNNELFQKRILGLTSYFRSAQEQLLPRLVKTEDNQEYHIIKSEMSDHQFSIYEKIRKTEADRERANKRNFKKIDKEMYTVSSTYKIFSRAACNFAFPSSITRPQPPSTSKDLTEDDINGLSIKERQNMDTFIAEDNANEEKEEIIDYNKQIENTLELLSQSNENGESEFLSTTKLQVYSPKFFKVLENVTDDLNKGCHLIYSQFRTIEGIGILRLVLLANGFAEFKIKKTNDGFDIIEDDNDIGKPKFVLYTGTESPEEKEIIRNIYNSNWELVPSNITSKLNDKFKDNVYGDVIKVFMITSSGAEGINLTNTRFVHIIEPYWHMVRIEQVIGRARRICSHQSLPEELRTVKVFLYVSTLSQEQKTSNKNIELRDRDRSRIDNKTPVTTDETLFEIANIKHVINKQILHSIKESAIDCELYSSKNKDENIVCYGYGKVSSNNFSSYPTFKNDKSSDKLLNQKQIKFVAQVITFNNIDYALNEKTMEVYDLDTYNEAINNNGATQPKYIGMLVQVGDKYQIQ